AADHEGEGVAARSARFDPLVECQHAGYDPAVCDRVTALRDLSPAGAQTTTLTILGGRAITLRGSPPPRSSCTLGSARAAAVAAASSMPGSTSRRARTLPLTCTTMVTV